MSQARGSRRRPQPHSSGAGARGRPLALARIPLARPQPSLAGRAGSLQGTRPSLALPRRPHALAGRAATAPGRTLSGRHLAPGRSHRARPLPARPDAQLLLRLSPPTARRSAFAARPPARPPSPTVWLLNMCSKPLPGKSDSVCVLPGHSPLSGSLSLSLVSLLSRFCLSLLPLDILSL